MIRKTPFSIRPGFRTCHSGRSSPLWLPFLNAGFTGVRHYSKAIALCIAASWALVECCRASSTAESHAHVTGVASALPIPQVVEEGYIWGTLWDSDEGAPGFEVLTEYPAPVTDAADATGSGYRGRVGDAFYFRSDAGELSSAPVTGGPRTVVARGVPERVLLTGLLLPKLRGLGRAGPAFAQGWQARAFCPRRSKVTH